MTPLPEIPQDKAQAAYETCVQDPQQMRYYANAPEGARQYIALVFYLRVYGHELSDELQQAYLLAVESELSTADLVYLIRCERDPEIKEHFTDLLSNHSLRRTSPAPASSASPVSSVSSPPPVEPQAGELRPMRLKTVAEAQGGVFDRSDGGETIDEVAERWRRETFLGRVRGFFTTVFTVLFWLLLLAALAVGGWYLWGKFKGGGEGPEPSGPGKVEPSQVSPEGPAAPSPAQTADARAEEQRQAREKRTAEQQRITDERQLAQQRKMDFDNVLRQFREARMDFWKNAPAEDRPGKVKEPLTFNCLVPETNSFAVLALLCKPDEPMVVQRLTPTADPIELPEADFKQLTAEVPFLVMREGRSYFCTPGKLSETTNAVPAYGESVNPSEETFGVLYDLVFKLRIKRPDFVWQVSFQPRDFETSIAICTARFGETVNRNRIYPKVREAMRIYQENLARQKAMRSMRGAKRPVRTLVLYDGDTIRKNINGVTQVPRSFTYTGSNRHKYARNSISHRVEARKEEEARARWLKLYTEAVRQENAERDANRTVEAAAASVEITSQEVEDVLNVGKMILKAVERD